MTGLVTVGATRGGVRPSRVRACRRRPRCRQRTSRHRTTIASPLSRWRCYHCDPETRGTFVQTSARGLLRCLAIRPRSAIADRSYGAPRTAKPPHSLTHSRPRCLLPVTAGAPGAGTPTRRSPAAPQCWAPLVTWAPRSRWAACAEALLYPLAAPLGVIRVSGMRRLFDLGARRHPGGREHARRRHTCGAGSATGRPDPQVRCRGHTYAQAGT